MKKELFVMKAPLSVQVHLGNPNMARIPELHIKPMPECEGSGWFMPADEANAIVDCWNGVLQRSSKDVEVWETKTEILENALRGYACSCPLGFCEQADDEGTMRQDDVACGFNARAALKLAKGE